MLRLGSCKGGWATYLAERAPDDKPYVAGDAWGCGGADYSGNWYNASALAYIERIQRLATARPWTGPGF